MYIFTVELLNNDKIIDKIQPFKCKKKRQNVTLDVFPLLI